MHDNSTALSNSKMSNKACLRGSEAHKRSKKANEKNRAGNAEVRGEKSPALPTIYDIYPNSPKPECKVIVVNPI